MSRDRYSNFANGIKNASTSIKHVADRWHLLKNLGDAMQRALDRNVVSLKVARRQKNIQSHKEIQPQSVEAKENEINKNGVTGKKFCQVKKMLLEGHSIKKISKETGVTRITIRKWKSYNVLPSKRSPKMTNMHFYDEVMRKLLDENPTIETKQVLQTITEMGYSFILIDAAYQQKRKSLSIPCAWKVKK